MWSKGTHLGFIFLIVTHHGFGNGWIGGGNFGHCSAVLSDVTVWNVDGQSLRTSSQRHAKGEMRFHGVLRSINIASQRFADQAGLNAGV